MHIMFGLGLVTNKQKKVPSEFVFDEILSMIKLATKQSKRVRSKEDWKVGMTTGDHYWDG